MGPDGPSRSRAGRSVGDRRQASRAAGRRRCGRPRGLPSCSETGLRASVAQRFWGMKRWSRVRNPRLGSIHTEPFRSARRRASSVAQQIRDYRQAVLRVGRGREGAPVGLPAGSSRTLTTAWFLGLRTRGAHEHHWPRALPSLMSIRCARLSGQPRIRADERGCFSSHRHPALAERCFLQNPDQRTARSQLMMTTDGYRGLGRRYGIAAISR